ncbi:hypothetical protein PMAYCL1PPCAC_23181 [Pristionchus mayeri]|uniref:Uncharacterized protein n=1 Tax=Pristionchus mayeri TaxID=1317129 RepID=A0AAN5CXK5_9BILA|nr:hypothetical protein PMAYCL1PPCAC_23181 [Pristionchus mayeri]
MSSGVRDNDLSCSPRRLAVLSSLHRKEISLATVAEATVEKGVITKSYLLSHHPIMEYGEQRTSCCACTKISSAMCKTCTLAKLSFYSRRMVIDKNIQVKKDREIEIGRLLSEEVKLSEETNSLTAVVWNLKKEINRRKMILNEKRNEVKDVMSRKEKSMKRMEVLKKVDTSLYKKPENRSIKDEKLLELEKHRTLYCRYVFGIYPLKIEKVEGDESEVYCIRNGRLPSTLLSSLNHSHPHSIPDPSSLALIVFSSHLVILLSHILDLPLPCELTVYSLISTSEAFRSQWNKLCICVSYLCGSLGVTPTDPHNSLISLFERLCEESPLRLNSTLPLTQFTLFQSPDAANSSMQSSTEWDTCDDFDPLTASVINPHGFK